MNSPNTESGTGNQSGGDWLAVGWKEIVLRKKIVADRAERELRVR